MTPTDLVTGFLLGLVLLVFVAVLTGTTLYYLRDSLVHPVVVANVLLLYFVVFPGGYLFLTADYYFALSDPDGMLLRALGLSLGAYLLAILTFARLDASALDDYLPADGRDSVPPPLLFWIGIAGFAAGVLFYLYYVSINGGFVRLLTVTPRTTFQTVPETARFRTLTILGTFGGLLTVLTAFTPWNGPGRRSSPRRGGVNGWRFAVIGTLVAITLLVSASFRSRLLILVPSAYLLVHFYAAGVIDRRHLFGLGGVVVVVGILFSFVEHLLIDRAELDIVILAAIHTTRLELLAVIVDRVPDSYPYLWGETFLRAVWITNEAFPLYGDYIDLVATGTDTVGVTRSGMFLGELYVNFGPIGALAGGVVYGALLRVAHRFRRHSNYLIRGAYPAAVVSTAFLFPTNAAWALKSLFLPFFPPLVAAAAAAYLYRRVSRAR